MPIVIAPLNVSLTIMKIATDQKTKRHLEDMGITINSKILILQQTGGSTICMVKDGRVALDKGVATKIFVA